LHAARLAAEQTLARARQHGNSQLVAAALEALGEVCFRLNEYARAHECAVEALGLYRALGDGAGDNAQLYQQRSLTRRKTTRAHTTSPAPPKTPKNE
jgi:hypothetical protein